MNQNTPLAPTGDSPSHPKKVSPHSASQFLGVDSSNDLVVPERLFCDGCDAVVGRATNGLRIELLGVNLPPLVYCPACVATEAERTEKIGAARFLLRAIHLDDPDVLSMISAVLARTSDKAGNER